jgi:hypothetical protein
MDGKKSSTWGVQAGRRQGHSVQHWCHPRCSCYRHDIQRALPAYPAVIGRALGSTLFRQLGLGLNRRTFSGLVAARLR